RTNYWQVVPANHLERVLLMEADRMGWLLPAMTQEKLDNQRDVVKNEKRQRYDNQPYGDWDERLQALVFPEDHPYHHTVIGSMADLEAATLDDVAEFFDTYYRPDNAVLAIAGDFESGKALEATRRWFGDIEPGGPVPPLPGNPALPPLIGGTVRDDVVANVPLPRVIMAFRIPPYSSPEFATVEVARALLGQGKASRLYRRLVRERRIAKSVVSFAFPLLTGGSMLLVWATGYPGASTTELEAALAEEIEALVDADPAEVARAIALTEADLVSSLEHQSERADRLAMFELYFDEPDRINRELERLEAVSIEQVRAFAAERLGPDNRAVVTYSPGGDR
ncbi:MAG TPA: pitrilysin family protein, partial [Longimicrobiales bacterium]|nr:pitrilysin family protein [Longimicrobiales bacterium]